MFSKASKAGHRLEEHSCKKSDKHSSESDTDETAESEAPGSATTRLGANGDCTEHSAHLEAHDIFKIQMVHPSSTNAEML